MSNGVLTRYEISTCEGKEHYATKKLADIVARRRKKKGNTVDVYKCPHCRDWHMGRNRRWRRLRDE